MAAANVLGTMRAYFEYSSAAAFARDWKELTEQDKIDIKKGFEDGTMTY